MKLSTSVIQLVIVDIDGCLTLGEAQPLDFEVFRRIADLNRKAPSDPVVPAITLCSGRAEPYVELMTQAIQGFIPALYEHGGGFFDPKQYRFVKNPAVTGTLMERFGLIKSTLEERIVKRGIGYFQPGKETSLTLYVNSSVTLDQLHNMVSEVLGAQADGFSIDKGIREINIVPNQIDKGVGVRWLAEKMNYNLSEIAGIGDAPADLTFLTCVGFSAAPLNAAPLVKEQVRYVSPFENGKGVLDILQKCIEQNQALLLAVD